ncbi:hypothetical protein F4821DRAFT_255255 [Hypoxylon rubiginosum]|uniref:Uncharacterized protein n=1 Tax=Hypoxylon rubiginosum TaxID=110542 RepID=A0ACC0DFE6_9PEZI|nr:hypothetical protein F4821DRAFT_255255 [Hypoxylon rubiginosum]
MRFFALTAPFVAWTLAAAVEKPERLKGRIAARQCNPGPQYNFTAQINYYGTDNCSGNATVGTLLTQSDNGCVNVGIASTTNSAKIVFCNALECSCTHYSERDCTGDEIPVNSTSSNCAPKSGTGSRSRQCTYV